MAIINKKGDRGSSCQIPLFGLYVAPWLPVKDDGVVDTRDASLNPSNRLLWKALVVKNRDNKKAQSTLSTAFSMSSLLSRQKSTTS